MIYLEGYPAPILEAILFELGRRSQQLFKACPPPVFSPVGRIVIDTEGRVPEEALSRRISLHVTGMSLPMGGREGPMEIAAGSSIGPTASEFGCMSLVGESGCGPYEPSEGAYPGRGQGQTVGGHP
jgi:hypothetical protein